MINGIAASSDNAARLRQRYYGMPGLFCKEILGMDLDVWQEELCGLFHSHDRFAVASGHSSGKSALSAGLILYFLAVHPDPVVIVTANTAAQLRDKTWRELAKWHNNSLIRDWFEWSATRYYLKAAPETWFASAVPNTPHSAESFAGAHAKHILMIFDEASAIDEAIWEVAEGATASPGGYRKWLVWGNPTRNSGSFFECFHRFRHRWTCKQIDTRGCKYADQNQIREWAEDYGEESDFFRVRVLGQFPQQSDRQFIGAALVNVAAERKLQREMYEIAPIVIGVDVARFGDDQSVIVVRQGLKLLKMLKYREIDTMQLASIVANLIDTDKPDAVFVDDGGVGAGVVDRLHQLGYRRQVLGVNFGSAATESAVYANKRMEMWARLKAWLEQGQISDDQELISDLVGPEYQFDLKERMLLEKKVDMKRRGLQSPDCGDALALTFAEPVAAARHDVRHDRMRRIYQSGSGGRRTAQAA